MDLAQFNKTQTSSKSSKAKTSSNPFTRTFLSVKDWVYPPITTLRQQRINQYKDLALFAGAAVVVAVFEDKIKNFL